jgi:hypothetical protein
MEGVKLKETDLYPPLKTYLENQGYSVHPEVNNCDIVARKNDELIIIELKTRVSVALLAQAVKRKRITDSVYVGVPLAPGKNHLPAFTQVKAVLKRLEVGLILVNFMKTKTRVQVIFHPSEYRYSRQHKKRFAIIREIQGRYAEFNLGGSPVKNERITAYKQEAIRIADILNKNGPLSPAALRSLGTDAKTQGILSGNVYGWFDRVERGVYRLNDEGRTALRRYREVIKAIALQT